MDGQPLIENDTGRSVELFDEIKNLYFDFATKIAWLESTGNNANWYYIIQKAEQQFNKLLNEMKVTDIKHYILGVAYKIFIQHSALSRLILNVNVEAFEKDGLPYLKNALELMESIKLQPEILSLYMLCVDLMSEFYNKNDKSKKTLELIAKNISQGVRAFDDYSRSQTKEALKLCDIAPFFKAYKDSTWNGTNSKLFFEKHPYLILDANILYRKMVIDLVCVSIDLNEEGNIIEKGALAVKYIFEDKNPIQDNIQYFYVGILIPIVLIYFEKNYLNQAMHLLAVAMYKVVEYRRSLPELQRSSVNLVQAQLSIFYCVYASRILRSALGLENRREVSVPTCDRAFEADGLAIYERQFPTEFVTDTKKLKSVLKKAVMWLERAEHLNTSTSENLMESILIQKQNMCIVGKKLISML